MKIIRKNAFTLAEVLVTLAVIGVVAALTIPSIVKNHQKQIWITKYKETHSLLNQATKMIMADNGGTLQNIWANNSECFDDYVQYLKIVKNCKFLDPHGTCFASSYILLNGDPTAAPPFDYSMILSNGVSVVVNSALIYIDVNGLAGPNVHGKDFHVFDVITATGEIKPYYAGLADSTIITRCPDNLITTDANGGRSCGVRIMRGDYGEDY